jgi:uncharacterized membrane protein YbhN (UPF0104 family)
MQMAEALRNAQLFWLIPALISLGAAFALQTERWRRLLLVQGITMGWGRTARVFLIGAFFNLFLLGSTGGDVVKIYYAMRETANRKSAAFLSVLVDRFMGVVGLVAVTCLLCSLHLGLLWTRPNMRLAVLVTAAVLGGSLALVAAGFLVNRFRWGSRIPQGLPLREKVLELATAIAIYAGNGRVLAATFGLSVGGHLLTFLAFFLVAQSFGLLPGWDGMVDLFSVLPVVMTMAALPVSLSGLGVRETMFEDGLALFGIPAAQAVMVSITGFLLIVFWGLVGGVIYLLYRPAGGIHLQELELEMKPAKKSREEQL